MSRIRIVCKAPPDTTVLTKSGFPILASVAPSIADCRVYAVGDDGSEVELTNVESITWRCPPNGDPVRARLTFFNAELDVEAEGP